jgi:hypothetical protein
MPACRVPILSTDPAPASATTDHLILRLCKETVQAVPNASRLRCRFRGVRFPYVPWPCPGLNSCRRLYLRGGNDRAHGHY